MDTSKREFLIVGTTVVVGATVFTACSSLTPTSPSSTTPLITLLRRDGYTVEELKNETGGVALLVNGKLQQIKVGTTLVGINPAMGMDSEKSGPPTLNFAQYEVPDNIGYVLVA